MHITPINFRKLSWKETGQEWHEKKINTTGYFDVQVDIFQICVSISSSYKDCYFLHIFFFHTRGTTSLIIWMLSVLYRIMQILLNIVL